MPHYHQPSPPFASRVDAGRPISGDLLAAATSVDVDLACSFLAEWLAETRALTGSGLVLVFHELVIGWPDPLLLEAAHSLRTTRRLELAGAFDHEEEEWDEEHEGDDETWEPPSLVDRVLVTLATGWEGERVASGSLVARSLHQRMQFDRHDVFGVVRLSLTLQRLLADLADAIRIGDAAVLDARLPSERRDSWRWAA